MKRKELFIVATIALLLVGCSPKATTESYCLMNNTGKALTISSMLKSKDVLPGEGYVITDITHYKGQDISNLPKIYEETWNPLFITMFLIQHKKNKPSLNVLFSQTRSFTSSDLPKTTSSAKLS